MRQAVNQNKFTDMHTGWSDFLKQDEKKPFHGQGSPPRADLSLFSSDLYVPTLIADFFPSFLINFLSEEGGMGLFWTDI